MSTTHHLHTTDTRLVSDANRLVWSGRRSTIRHWARTNGWRVRPTNPLDTPTRRVLAAAELSAR